MVTVLLVDDDRIILELFTVVLEKLGGFRVLRAADGQTAIKTASQYRGDIDLLLSDIVMPGDLSGVQVAEILEECRPKMKVLLMSGCNISERMSSYDCHGWKFLPKPFSPAALLSKIQEILG